MANRYKALHPYLSYYMNLAQDKIINMLKHRYKGKSVVYGIRCMLNNKIYVGSTVQPGLRFDNHLITHTNSNANLQADIKEHGIENFVVYIFEVIPHVNGMDFNDHKVELRKLEQKCIDRFSKDLLYNNINSSVK